MVHEILKFKAIPYYILSIFASKICLTGFQEWSKSLKEQDADYIKSLFLCRLGDWQEEVLPPLTKHCFNEFQQYSFVNNITLRAPNSNPSKLHSSLIMEASKCLRDLCRLHTFSKNTNDQIREWFTIVLGDTGLRLIQSEEEQHTASSYSADVRSNLFQSQDKGQQQDYPFFFAKVLFIYLAQVTFQHCYESEGDELEGSEDWQLECGATMNAMFDINQAGLCPTKFDIELPLIGHLKFVQNDGQAGNRNNRFVLATPPVHHTHEYYISTIKESIYTQLKESTYTPEQDEKMEQKLLVRIFHQVETRLSTHLVKLKEREKVKISNWNKKSPTKIKARSPQSWRDDRFLVGDQSYHHVTRINHLGAPPPNASRQDVVLHVNQLSLKTPPSKKRRIAEIQSRTSPDL